MEVVKNEGIVMTRSEIEKHYKVFNSNALAHLRGAKFAFFIEKNKRLINQEIDRQQAWNQKLLKKRGNISEEYIKAEEEILKQYCHKDEAGEPIIKNGMYSIPDEEVDEFVKSKEAALSAVPEFAGETEKIKKYSEAIEKYLNEKITFVFHLISESDVPTDISAAELSMISDYVM